MVLSCKNLKVEFVIKVSQFVYGIITLCNYYENFIYNLIQHWVILKCDGLDFDYGYRLEAQSYGMVVVSNQSHNYSIKFNIKFHVLLITLNNNFNYVFIFNYNKRYFML